MKKVFKIVITIIVFLVVIAGLTRLLEPKYSESLREGTMTPQYYQESKDHEVMIFGDSCAYANFSPMVMYETAGIKAYVRGNAAQFIWQSYYLMKEALKYETPKVIVLSVDALVRTKDTDPKTEGYNRLCIDRMRWSKEKVDIIKASMKDDESFLTYVFPIIRYHTRISQLTGEDFRYFFGDKYHTYNGFLVNKEIKPLGDLPVKRQLPSYDFPAENVQYLEDIAALCKEHGVQLMLIKVPNMYPHWYDEYDEWIEAFAAEHGIVYENLRNYYDEIGLDFNVDTYDAGIHLNFTGAEKNSRFFAGILKKHYDLTDYSGDALYDSKLAEYKKERE